MMAQAPDILFLIVIYGNHDVASTFVQTQSAKYISASFAISDNSPRTEQNELHALASHVVVRRPDNPGYFGGAMAAYAAHCEKSSAPRPDWVVICNTDLSFDIHELVEALASHSNLANAMSIIAPRIRELPSGRELNPHIRHRPPARWYRLRGVLGRSVVLCWFYLLASRLMHCLRRSPRTVVTSVPNGASMFAPHGSFIVFSRPMIDCASEFARVPLLAEEYAVALASLRCRAAITLDTSVTVTHCPHSTTGSAISLFRARLLRRAFRYIADHQPIFSDTS